MRFSQDTQYIYVLVRKDLSLPQQTVQSCHAVIEATRLFVTSEQTHPHLVLCSIQDEEALKREAIRFEAYNIKFVPFYEPDLNNQLTAIATAPIAGDDRRVCRRYNLLNQVIEARVPP